MMKKYTLLALFPLLFSCSQPSKKPTTEEYFVTHILADGTKMFSYVLERANDTRRRVKSNNRGRGGAKRQNRGNRFGQSQREGGDQRMKSRLYDKLDKRLSQNNFCREGYDELNTSFNGRRAEIKGQCREKATEKDRVMFKNQ